MGRSTATPCARANFFEDGRATAAAMRKAGAQHGKQRDHKCEFLKHGGLFCPFMRDPDNFGSMLGVGNFQTVDPKNKIVGT